LNRDERLFKGFLKVKEERKKERRYLHTIKSEDVRFIDP